MVGRRGVFLLLRSTLCGETHYRECLIRHWPCFLFTNIVLLNMFGLIGCGLLVNNTLKSPGYPSHYPSNTHCVYSVSIPEKMALKIVFLDFWLQDPLIPHAMSLW